MMNWQKDPKRRRQVVTMVLAALLVIGVTGVIVACVAGVRLPGASDCDPDDIIERDKDCGFKDKSKTPKPVAPKPQVSKRK